MQSLYNFIVVECACVYRLRCNEVIADAVGAKAKSVVPWCTLALPPSSIPGVGNAAVAVFLQNCILKLANNNYTHSTGFIFLLQCFNNKSIQNLLIVIEK